MRYECAFIAHILHSPSDMSTLDPRFACALQAQPMRRDCTKPALSQCWQSYSTALEKRMPSAFIVLIMRRESTTLLLWNRYQIALLALTEHRDRALLSP